MGWADSWKTVNKRIKWKNVKFNLDKRGQYKGSKEGRLRTGWVQSFTSNAERLNPTTHVVFFSVTYILLNW